MLELITIKPRLNFILDLVDAKAEVDYNRGIFKL
jgi:hypothetical protein